MSIEQLKERLSEFQKDTRLNVSNLFGNISQTGLSENQFYVIALSVAYTLKNKDMVHAILVDSETAGVLNIEEPSKIAATLMAMNNVYYRATHLAEDKELNSMPAQLRMTAIGNPGIPKIDFELAALAVSAINACGLCIQSHVKQLEQHAVTKAAIQSTLRVAAVLNALDMGLSCELI